MTCYDAKLHKAILRCPCCRSKMKRGVINMTEHFFECVDCGWKTKTLLREKPSSQIDIDRMRLREIEVGKAEKDGKA